MTKQRETRGLLRAVFAAVCVLVGVATCGSALALRLDVNEPPPAATAAPTPNGRVVRIAAGVEAGSRIGGENPVYPAQAKADKDTVDGTCSLKAIINKDGIVSNLQVIKSLRRDYDEAAIKAVKTWHYKPFLLNGEPTAVETTINVTFTLGT